MQSDEDTVDTEELSSKLGQQEKSLKEYLKRIKDSRSSSKRSVKRLFSELRNVLFNKELEIIRSIETKTSGTTRAVEACLTQTVVKSGIFNSIPDHEDGGALRGLYTQILDDVESCLHVGETLLTGQIITYDVNDSAKGKLEDIRFGKFNDETTNGNDLNTDTGSVVNNDDNDTAVAEEITQDETSQLLNTYVDDVERDPVGNLQPSAPPIVLSNSQRISNTDTVSTVNQNRNDTYEAAGEGTHNESVQPRNTLGQDVTGALVRNAQPSAPPLSPDEEPPPPYWQAVGLSEPTFTRTEGACSQSTLDEASLSRMKHAHGHTDVGQADSFVSWSDYLDRTSQLREWSNHRSRIAQLEVYDSFNVVYESSILTPWPVALCSHNEIVCLADRSNSSITFLTVDGTYLGAWVFHSPVFDVKFFGEDGDALMFLATFPLENKFRVIYFQDRIIKNRTITHEPLSQHQYTTVCKGPDDVPFLGASTMKKPCKVRTFDHRSELIDFINNDNYFSCPRSCLSYKSNVIVSDWSLGLVCIFTKNGEPLGRYTGTSMNPLVNPDDIAVDPDGYVYILCGRMSTVHVIDQRCYFLHLLKVPEASGNDQPKLVEYLARTNKLAIVRESGQEVELFEISIRNH